MELIAGEEDSELPHDLTIPSNLGITARAFPNEEFARSVIYKFHSVLSVLSRHIDLKNLDGVTIAYDYENALLELDRGYETNYKLVPTKGIAIGVAMAPTVIRGGQVKTHLVVNANLILGILGDPKEEPEEFGLSLHLIAHECAHVEVTAAFDAAFPEMLLRKTHDNVLDSARWNVIFAAWDEYAVCRIASSIGSDPTNGYLETLLDVLAQTRKRILSDIQAYRVHRDLERIVAEVYGQLGELLKFASYYLGTVTSNEETLTHPTALIDASEFSWFQPFYEQLAESLSTLWVQFGCWESLYDFGAIGDILEKMAESLGVKATRISNQVIWFDIQ